MFDDEIFKATFSGINLPVNAVCQCQHPFLADDGATASVFSP